MRLEHAPGCWGSEQTDGSIKIYPGITHWVELSETPRQMAGRPHPTWHYPALGYVRPEAPPRPRLLEFPPVATVTRSQDVQATY